MFFQSHTILPILIEPCDLVDLAKKKNPVQPNDKLLGRPRSLSGGGPCFRSIRVGLPSVRSHSWCGLTLCTPVDYPNVQHEFVRIHAKRPLSVMDCGGAETAAKTPSRLRCCSFESKGKCHCRSTTTTTKAVLLSLFNNDNNKSSVVVIQCFRCFVIEASKWLVVPRSFSAEVHFFDKWSSLSVRMSVRDDTG